MKKKYQGFTTGYPEREPIVWNKNQILQAYIFCACMVLCAAVTIVAVLVK
jgi:hypothetical protein